VGDPGAIQIVNQAQADYVKDYVAANLPRWRRCRCCR
jgi:2',3'-cyclic-nucleotide 2'-phosphodiesterase/3'-nucleotidase